MDLQPGVFLHSTPALDDTLFEGVSIFLAEYNSDGAVGFVVNRAFGRNLNELQEFHHCAAFPLSYGGPVGSEHLFFLHQRPDIVEDGVACGEGIYIGGDFRQVLAGMNGGKLTAHDLKIFVGYCGWDGGELEAEVEEGSWEVVSSGEGLVFGNAQG